MLCSLKIRASNCLLKTHDYANSIEDVYDPIIAQCRQYKTSVLFNVSITYGKWPCYS